MVHAKILCIEPANLQETLFFIWRLRNQLNDVEFQVQTMYNLRNPTMMPRGLCQMPPLIVNDEEKDANDEEAAEQLIISIKDCIDQFIMSHAGIEIKS